jgi:hypothetical protein
VFDVGGRTGFGTMETKQARDGRIITFKHGVKVPKTVVKLADAGKRLRLKKMQIAGYLAHASAKNQILVGFYKDKSGKIRPVTKAVVEVRRKKVVKQGKQFKSVRPRFRVVKGIRMSEKEYRAFVDYLNNFRIQEFTKSDVEEWLRFRSGKEKAPTRLSTAGYDVRSQAEKSLNVVQAFGEKMTRNERNQKNPHYVPKWGKQYRHNGWVWMQVDKKVMRLLQRELKAGKKITEGHIQALESKTLREMQKKNSKYHLLR